MASTSSKDPVEARLKALEKGLADVYRRIGFVEAEVARLKRERARLSGPSAIRSRGPKAQMTDEAWLAQRRKMAEHMRAVAAKTAAKKKGRR